MQTKGFRFSYIPEEIYNLLEKVKEEKISSYEAELQCGFLRTSTWFRINKETVYHYYKGKYYSDNTIERVKQADVIFNKCKKEGFRYKTKYQFRKENNIRFESFKSIIDVIYDSNIIMGDFIEYSDMRSRNKAGIPLILNLNLPINKVSKADYALYRKCLEEKDYIVIKGKKIGPRKSVDEFLKLYEIHGKGGISKIFCPKTTIKYLTYLDLYEKRRVDKFREIFDKPVIDSDLKAFLYGRIMNSPITETYVKYRNSKLDENMLLHKLLVKKEDTVDNVTLPRNKVVDPLSESYGISGNRTLKFPEVNERLTKIVLRSLIESNIIIRSLGVTKVGIKLITLDNAHIIESKLKELYGIDVEYIREVKNKRVEHYSLVYKKSDFKKVVKDLYSLNDKYHCNLEEALYYLIVS